MTDDALLAPFDEKLRSQVAAANDVEIDQLESALAAHQRTMRENPGVEDLVYEWRKQYDDPVLLRTPDLFVLALPPAVWEQYADYLDFDDETLAAVAAAHQERTIRTESVQLASIPEDRVALVVSRF